MTYGQANLTKRVLRLIGLHGTIVGITHIAPNGCAQGTYKGIINEFGIKLGSKVYGSFGGYK
jgi:hypothetical protein